MTEPVSGGARHEKLYCDIDDEPRVCEQKATKSKESSSVSEPEAALESAIDRNERQPQRFGAFASPSYDGSGGHGNGDAATGGARGAPGGPPDPEIAAPTPRESFAEGRGAGIALGLNAGFALGVGPGLSASIEGGIILHQNGISLYESSTKLPTHCEKPNGEPDNCSTGIGATAGVGVALHLIPDVDKVEGDGRVAAIETPVGTVGASSNDKETTSLDGGAGPSVGAAMHVTHVETRVTDVVQFRPIRESAR